MSAVNWCNALHRVIAQYVWREPGALPQTARPPEPYISQHNYHTLFNSRPLIRCRRALIEQVFDSMLNKS